MDYPTELHPQQHEHQPHKLQQHERLQQQQQQQQQQQHNRDYSPSPHTPMSMNHPPSSPSPLPSPHHQATYSTPVYGTFGGPTYFGGGAAAYAMHQQHYAAEMQHQQQQRHQQQQQQQHQQPHPHYDNTFTGRLSGGAAASGSLTPSHSPSYYSNRTARYFPYQQPNVPSHSMRGMYTPAGQQLIPSSVLHYPPRGAPYEANANANANAMALQQQQQQLQQRSMMQQHSQYTQQMQQMQRMQPQLRQQQEAQGYSQSHPSPSSFAGGTDAHLRHYNDNSHASHAQQTMFAQASTGSTPNLIMHLNSGPTSAKPPTSALTPTPTPTSTPTTPSPSPSAAALSSPAAAARSPSVDNSAQAYLQMQRQQHFQQQQKQQQKQEQQQLQRQQQLQQYHQQQAPSAPPSPGPSLTNNAFSSIRSQQSQAQSQYQHPTSLSTTVNVLPSNSTSSEMPRVNKDAQVNVVQDGCHGQERPTNAPPPSTTHSIDTPLSLTSNAVNVTSTTRNISSPQLTATNNGDCLTTSPPLISATGTDSGISVSSCSARTPRSDSTQSTPVYNSEYPMSVGSSSGGVSYHFVDIKDFEEFGREKVETPVPPNAVAPNENEVLKLKQEIVEDDCNSERRLKEGGVDKSAVDKSAACEIESESGERRNIAERSATETTKQLDDKSTKNQPEESVLNLDASLRPNASNTNTEYSAEENQRTQLCETESTKETCTQESTSKRSENEEQQLNLEPKQQQGQKEHQTLDQLNAKQTNTNASSSDYVNQAPPPSQSPRCYELPMQSPYHSSDLAPSPSAPPAPPQNSPVDYCLTTEMPNNISAYAYTPLLPSVVVRPPSKPSTSAAAAAAAAAVAAAAAAAAAASIRPNKSRIMENDLIPSKKSKRKSHYASSKWHKDVEGGGGGGGGIGVDESGKEKRDMTPLPGFQQAFGSTEIGRFFETFLFSPADCHSFSDSYETFEMEEQLQQQIQKQQQQQQQQQQQELQQQKQLQIKQEQEQVRLNDIQKHHEQQQQQHQLQQQQQQQFSTSYDYFNRRYSDISSYHAQQQRLHPHYPQPTHPHSYAHPHLPPSATHPYYNRGSVHPYAHPYGANSMHSYRDMWLYGRAGGGGGGVGGSPYHNMSPFDYGGTRSSAGDSPLSPYDMSPLSAARSAYGSAYDRMAYTGYGRQSGSFSGIRCNGY